MKKKNHPRWGERIFVRVRKREKEREVSVGGFCGCAKCIFCRNNKVKRVCLSVCLSLSAYFFRFSFLLLQSSSRLSRQKKLCVLCVFSTRRERKQQKIHTHTHTHSRRRRRRRRRQNSRPHKKPQTRSLSLCVNTKNNNNATSFIDDARRGI